LAEELFKRITKKFSGSCKAWWLFGQFYLLNGQHQQARDLLQSALRSLPKRKHVKTILKFAQLEYKHGEFERGRTMFEGVLATYPKRIDLWSVYIDKEIGMGDVASVRRLFERATSLSLSSKKAKFFFKKWLEWEKSRDDMDGIEVVKQRAMAYVQAQ
jgi:rRNA biogenesis protein RRP5